MEPRRVVAGPEALAEAVRVVKAGGLVAVPTDTVYGLACDPSRDPAVRALFEAKGRESKPVPLLCAGIAAAESFVVLNPRAKKLARLHWPGALTIVAPLRVGAKVSSLVHQGSGYVGVRMPDSDFCIALAGKAGGAVTGTSANLSGQPSCRTAEQVIQSLGASISLVVDGGRLRGKESTVVKVLDETVEVLREGSVRIQAGDLKQ